MIPSSKRLLIPLALGGLAALAVATTPCLAGGELPSSPDERPLPARRYSLGAGASTIRRSAIGPITGGVCVARLAPLPSPSRTPCWGAECSEEYGPTYYYPERHKMWEGNHPTYYPFLAPPAGPNYKVPGTYACPGGQCGSSRSRWTWDSYDDWTRSARYEERQ